MTASLEPTVPSEEIGRPPDGPLVDSWRVELDPRMRYEPRGALGRGGMGEVELAFDRGIERQVAVKRLIRATSTDVARFVDEARIVGRMEHPNVVPVHDIGVDADGRPYFVMKYVEGETLRRVIDKLADGEPEAHRRFPLVRRLDVFAGLLRALQYAHGLGIIHRDIKPENIMVGPYGEVVLMDWGIARRIGAPSLEEAAATTGSRSGDYTTEGACIGTPPYMSPEQAAGRSDLDGRSDLYSAFVVFYELLTLQRYIPRTSRSLPEVLVAVQDRSPPELDDPAWMNPHQIPIAAELRHLLRHGLQNATERRYATADAALEALARVRAGEFPIECPVTLAKRFSIAQMRMLDRRPTVGLAMTFMMFAAPVAVAVATIIGLAWWLLRS